MTVKTTHTAEVQELLNKVAGFHTEGGDERTKKIVHRFMGDIFQLIEDFDVTPEEFWTAVNYVSELGKNNEAALLYFFALKYSNAALYFASASLLLRRSSYCDLQDDIAATATIARIRVLIFICIY